VADGVPAGVGGVEPLAEADALAGSGVRVRVGAPVRLAIVGDGVSDDAREASGVGGTDAGALAAGDAAGVGDGGGGGGGDGSAVPGGEREWEGGAVVGAGVVEAGVGVPVDEPGVGAASPSRPTSHTTPHAPAAASVSSRAHGGPATATSAGAGDAASHTTATAATHSASGDTYACHAYTPGAPAPPP
jgi:hypothetical protein